MQPELSCGRQALTQLQSRHIIAMEVQTPGIQIRFGAACTASEQASAKHSNLRGNHSSATKLSPGLSMTA